MNSTSAAAIFLCDPSTGRTLSDQFAAHLIWMSDEALLPGRTYLMKLGARTVADHGDRAQAPARRRLRCRNLRRRPWPERSRLLQSRRECARSPSIPYKENHVTGAFILIDRYTNATVAAGLIAFGLRRATNVHLQDLTRHARSAGAAEASDARRRFGSPAFPAPANRPSPISSRRSSYALASTRSCSTATMSATG